MIPKISVVIPVFNVEKYLSRALNSVKQQSFSDWELICVNDGSTDASGKIIDSFMAVDSRIRKIEQSNQGQSRARNAGLHNAAGKYVYFLDSDDYIVPDALTKLWQTAERDQLDTVVFSAEVLYGYSADVTQYHYTLSSDYKSVMSGEEAFCALSLHGERQTHCSIVFCRREFLLSQRLDFQDGAIYEDGIWCLRVVLEAARVGVFPEKLFYYCKRAGSITTSKKTIQHLLGRARWASSVWEYYIARRFSDKEVCKHLSGEILTAIHALQYEYISIGCPPLEKIKQESADTELIDFIFFSCFKNSVINELILTQNSASYRIGRGITWLPRKIVAIIRSTRNYWLQKKIVCKRESAQ